MKIMFVGDTHANEQFLRYACEKAVEFDCDLLFQVGDWGFISPHDNRLGRMEKHLADYDMRMIFIDGNHEHFSEWKRRGINTDSREAILVTPHCSYSPRGYTWEWDGIKFMSLGGAISVDRAMRKEGVSYFKDEAITDADVERCLEAGSVDVLITHDTVHVPPRLGAHLQVNGWKLSRSLREDCLLNTTKISTVARALKPTLMIHGHYHYPYADMWEGIRVRGLCCDGSGGAALHVFDTEAYHEGYQT